MKCVNCGASYPDIKEQCPYCGRENKLGKYWNWQERTAQNNYEGVKKDVITNGTLYVINKILNAIMGVMIGLMVLIVVITFIACYIGDSVEQLAKGQESAEQIQSLYEAADYHNLYEGLE